MNLPPPHTHTYDSNSTSPQKWWIPVWFFYLITPTPAASACSESRPSASLCSAESGGLRRSGRGCTRWAPEVRSPWSESWPLIRCQPQSRPHSPLPPLWCQAYGLCLCPGPCLALCAHLGLCLKARLVSPPAFAPGLGPALGRVPTHSPWNPSGWSGDSLCLLLICGCQTSNNWYLCRNKCKLQGKRSIR